MVDFDKLFLVITQKCGAQFRRAEGVDMGMQGIRARLMGALRTDGKFLSEGCSGTGPFKKYVINMASGNSYRVTLIWGEDRDGKPQFAPDGEKRMVFAVELVPVR